MCYDIELQPTFHIIYLLAAVAPYKDDTHICMVARNAPFTCNRCHIFVCD